MTLPDERARSIIYAKRYLLEIINNKKLKLKFRKKAEKLLSEFPSRLVLVHASKNSDDVIYLDSVNEDDYSTS